MSTDIAQKIKELIEIVVRLRGPDGCPWDKEQTASSFKSYLIEETHELVEAIDKNSIDSIKEELGDLFFQLFFLCRIYEENEDFTAAEAIESICQKMIRRHPHVFGNTTVNSIEEQKRLWMSIKAKEKSIEGKSNSNNFLEDVPKSLPALRRAQRVVERAAHAGFEWPDLNMIFSKISEETRELQEAIETGDKNRIFEEIGDLIFTTVNLGRYLGIHTEDALHNTTVQFIDRFAEMQKILSKEKLTLPDVDIEKMLQAWQQGKKR